MNSNYDYIIVINNKNKLINMKIKVNFIILMIILIKMINKIINIKNNFNNFLNLINKTITNQIKKNLFKIKYMIKINYIIMIFKLVKII